MKNFKNRSKQRLLRKLILTASLMAGISTAQAGGRSDYYVISKMFSSTGKPQITIIDGDNSKATIYDENMNVTKSFTFKRAQIPFKEVIEERLVIPGEYDDVVVNEYSHEVTGLEEAIDYANSYGCSSHTKKGNVHTFLPLELPEGDGEYTKIVYTEGEDHLMVYNIIRYPKYSDWQVTKDESGYTTSTYIDNSYLYNYDEDIVNDNFEFFLTQTMFNNDDKYEYVIPIYEINSEGYTDESDYVYRPDGNDFPTKRRTTYYYVQTRVDIVSEDGNVIMSIPGNIDNFFLYGGKMYAEVRNENRDINFYLIDTQTNSIQAVQSEAVKIFPRMAGRGESITVEIGDKAADKQHEVLVTTMGGSIVRRVIVPAGQKETHINTTNMAGGIYNFTVYVDKKKTENGKIIIR